MLRYLVCDKFIACSKYFWPRSATFPFRFSYHEHWSAFRIALEAGTRKKLSNWLVYENSSPGNVFAHPSDRPTLIDPVSPRVDGANGEKEPLEQFSSLRLPPASPLKDAENFFYQLALKSLEPTCKTSKIMIKGFCKKVLVNEAEKLFKKMEEVGCSGNDVTYNTIIKGCIHNNDLSTALIYRDLMVSKGFEADVVALSLFVDLLSSGSLSDSSKGLLEKFIKKK